MIYNNSYFNKEIQRAYIDNRISTKWRLFFGVLLGLTAIGVHFIFLSLSETFLALNLSYLTYKSCFSVLLLYTNLSLIFFLLYYITFSKYAMLSEIRSNKWYLLVKMGYNPISMVFTKIFARFFALAIIYSIGFVIAFLLSVIFEYNLLYHNISVLFIFMFGLIDIALLCVAGAVSSFMAKKTSLYRLLILIIMVLFFYIKRLTGFTNTITSKYFFEQNQAFSIFNHRVNTYFFLVAFFIILCLAFCLYRAKVITMYFKKPHNLKLILPKNTKLARYDDRNKRYIILRHISFYPAKRFALNTVVITSLIVLVIFALIMNIFNFFIISDRENHFEIGGNIPYISNITLEPEIYKNDFLIFSSDKNIKNDIVISKNNNRLAIKKSKDASTDAIIGTLIYKSRGLGALFVLCNTVGGRIIFLLIPALILLFYKRLTGFFTEKIDDKACDFE